MTSIFTLRLPDSFTRLKQFRDQTQARERLRDTEQNSRVAGAQLGAQHLCTRQGGGEAAVPAHEDRCGPRCAGPAPRCTVPQGGATSGREAGHRGGGGR